MVYTFSMDTKQAAMEIVDSSPYLINLNEVQRRAVETTEGPLLVLAGAGTGKTRVLTTRYAHILLQKLAQPSEILAVTFTNKASREMKQRIEDILQRSVEGLWLGTFHSLAGRILRRHAERVNRTSDFTILDSNDQIHLLKQLIAAHHLDEKKFPARSFLSVISRWKDRGLTPEKVPLEDLHGQGKNNPYLQIYKEYQDRLQIDRKSVV